MPVATPKQADDILRARDAQTVISPGVDVGPADDARIEREAVAKRAAGRSSTLGLTVIALVIVVGGALALAAL